MRRFKLAKVRAAIGATPYAVAIGGKSDEGILAPSRQGESIVLGRLESSATDKAGAARD